jgi:hypothetical protein
VVGGEAAVPFLLWALFWRSSFRNCSLFMLTLDRVEEMRE